MKLIEKIVDKLLNDGEYAIGVMVFSFSIICLVVSMSMSAYRQKLDHELKLAKIAAGQMVDIECECKPKCK